MPTPSRPPARRSARTAPIVDAGENDNLIVQKLEANPTSLGIFGYSFLDQNIDKLQGSTIQGVAPTFENIADGKYPVARSLYFYVKNAHVGVIPGIREYIAEFTSEAAIGEDGYLADKGLIPLPEDQIAAGPQPRRPSSSRCRCRPQPARQQPRHVAARSRRRHPVHRGGRLFPGQPARGRGGRRALLRTALPAGLLRLLRGPAGGRAGAGAVGGVAAAGAVRAAASRAGLGSGRGHGPKPGAGRLLHERGPPPGRRPAAGRRGDAGAAGGRRLLRHAADLQPGGAAGRPVPRWRCSACRGPSAG